MLSSWFQVLGLTSRIIQRLDEEPRFLGVSYKFEWGGSTPELAEIPLRCRGDPKQTDTPYWLKQKLCTEYLVRWKGLPSTHDEWVREQDAVGAEELIYEYEKRQDIFIDE
ncbi:hypothetical protein N7495_006316 [Penicillium taxi]|uniref:uncharacterized protein n=1 Tax=Penicillium taxi TaxID=168475 RepID=UPI0025453FA2|nr:uncharacterized protein N7495_006316 [Penicillium taxi]KAJ5894625.1 hypothetical protein N7495_006316 [Penicillium taxi]